MPTKIYIAQAFIIAEDLVTRTPYFKEKKENAFHLRSDDDQFTFYPSESVWNTGDNLQPLKLRVPTTLKWDTQQLEPDQKSSFEFTDIVDASGVAYASADALNTYLNENLGFFELIQPVVVPDYFKDSVLVTTDSNNFNSNIPSDVTGLSYVITADGDYVFYSIVNTNNDQNEELEMYYAVNGVTILDSVVIDRQQKNQDQSMQNTLAIDGLIIGDIVTVQFNTRNDNVDLRIRRILIQSWNLV